MEAFLIFIGLIVMTVGVWIISMRTTIDIYRERDKKQVEELVDLRQELKIIRDSQNREYREYRKKNGGEQ